MARILVSDKLSEKGLAVLRAQSGFEVDYTPGLSEAEFLSRIADYDGLVIRSASKVTHEVLEHARALRVVGRAGVGVDNVDVPAATRRGVLVMNTPGGNSISTAEHAIGLLFALARKIPQATASMRAGRWDKSKFEGREIFGKTIGVIGVGRVGAVVADRARGLHMHVLAFDPMLDDNRALELGVEKVDLPELFRRSDFITIHTPLNDKTRGIVNDASIELMKKGVLLVNCARGGVYDEDALVRGLESGKLGGVALDVYQKEPPAPDHKLLSRDDVVITPHLGASTKEAQERVAVEIAHQIVDYLVSGKAVHAVNPDVIR